MPSHRSKFTYSKDTIIRTPLLHPDLLIAQERAYEPSGLLCTNLMPEAESQAYGACTFKIGPYKLRPRGMGLRLVIFRVAKITPTKHGQFVTFWKRSSSGPIAPYDLSDLFDFFVVSVRMDTQLGQFVFPKSVLHEKGILSKEGVGGKRALRVYPSWSKPMSKQAQQTQLWQSTYFFEIDPNTLVNSSRARKLFSCISGTKKADV